MFKKLTIIAIIVVVVGVAIVVGFSRSSSSNEKGFTLVKVQKGDVVDKALAIGMIEPEREISVKSQVSGIVSKIFVEVGDQVSVGDPLVDIAPQPTPIEYAEAKRQVELQEVAFLNAGKTFNRTKELMSRGLVSQSEMDNAQEAYDQAELHLKSARERLSLIDEGKTNIAGRVVENLIRSPIEGMVLQLDIDEGDPVVPLTSYQSGTSLLTLAEMQNLIFRGTVDEIDVGKLNEQMNVQIKVGALPNDTVSGILYKISPKAKKQENTTLFDVEIKITSITKAALRAGYSANAEIIIKEKRGVLTIPERLVTFSNDSAFVDIKDSVGTSAKTNVQTGLSDGINIEVLSGLTEGQEIVEKPPKTIK